MKKALNFLVVLMLFVFCSYQGINVYLTKGSLNKADGGYDESIKSELDKWLEDQTKKEQVLKENNNSNADGEFSEVGKDDSKQEIEEVLPVYSNYYDMMMITLKKYRLWNNVTSNTNMYGNIVGYTPVGEIPIKGKFTFEQAKNQLGERYLQFVASDVDVKDMFQGGYLQNKYYYNGFNYKADQFFEMQKYSSDAFIKKFGYDLNGIYFNLDPAHITDVKRFTYNERTQQYFFDFTLDVSKQSGYNKLWYGMTSNKFCTVSKIEVVSVECSMVIDKQCKIVKIMTQEQINGSLTYGSLKGDIVAKFSSVQNFDYYNGFINVPVF